MYQFKLIIFISIFFLIGSEGCKKEELHKEWFNAEVLGMGMDCGDTFLINFMEGDKEKIFQTMEIEEDAWFPTYYAFNLPNEFKIGGLQVRIKFGKPTSDESKGKACTTFGPGFSHIWIKEIEKLNK